MAKRAEKISRTLLLLLDQVVEPIEITSLPYRVGKFSRNLFSDEQKYRRPQVKRALAHLVKSNLIQAVGEKITLTEAGRKRAQAVKADLFITRKPKHWDGKWRMIVFDIPESKRRSRDSLRHKLKELRFFKLQDSIWIYPYECRQAVSHLADYYDIRENVHFAIVDVFDQEEAARQFYGIRESALPYEGEQRKISIDF